jgi:hypothetical protein
MLWTWGAVFCLVASARAQSMDEDSTMPIVGGSIGGLVFIIAVVIIWRLSLAYFCVNDETKKKKRQATQPAATPPGLTA